MKRKDGPQGPCGNCPAECGCTGSTHQAAPQLFEEERPAELDSEQAAIKRQIYEQMNPRRRKFIDRIGYDMWDPFQAPKEPLDIRTDRTRRTLQDLMRDFLKAHKPEGKDPAWRQGALDCALGIIKKDERYQGIFDFCLWYSSILEEEEKRQ